MSKAAETPSAEVKGQDQKEAVTARRHQLQIAGHVKMVLIVRRDGEFGKTCSARACLDHYGSVPIVNCDGSSIRCGNRRTPCRVENHSGTVYSGFAFWRYQREPHRECVYDASPFRGPRPRVDLHRYGAQTGKGQEHDYKLGILLQA